MQSLSIKKMMASTFMLLVVSLGLARAQEVKEQVMFRFVAGNDMFFSPWNGNGENLVRLTDFVNAHKESFVSGAATIYVSGYCANRGKALQRLQRAKTMSNRVKSEIIMRCGLSERHFITRNTATAYEGQKNIVLVNVTILAQKTTYEIQKTQEAPQEQPKQEQPHVTKEESQPQSLQATPEPVIAATAPSTSNMHTGFSLRTNLLYWAAATPNIGIEWRISPSYGIKIDGGYGNWEYNGKDKIQKLWFVNPEVRRYMLESKRFYMGIGVMLGEYNLKLGKTGYQGNLYGGALTTGYQLPMGKHFSWDFNIGLGAAHFSYNTFDVIDGVRVFKVRNSNKTLFIPTQVGVNLIWHIGNPSLKQ